MKNSRDIKLLFKRLKKMNNFLVLNALLIVCISISTIYSATISRTSSFYIKESIWTVIGLIAYLVVTMIDYTALRGRKSFSSYNSICFPIYTF